MEEATEITQTQQDIDFKNPYPGLRPFQPEESHLFFGRENQVSDVLNKLIENSFIGIIGKSGIGKSSFINCGILPKLYSDYPGMNSSEWDVITFRPGHDPIKQLATAFYKEVETRQLSEEVTPLSIDDIYDILQTKSHQGLSELVKNFIKSSGKNLLLFIDQFEEVFRFKSETESVTDSISLFIDIIIKTAKEKEIPVYVAITMRSDYIGECSKYPLLTKVINQSQFLIPQMTREEKRDAIIGPCRVMGANIGEDLVNEILNSVGDDSVQLPVMQHSLMRTWDYWEENKIGNETINVNHYRATGGMEKALSVHANEIFNSLDPRLKLACEKCFKSLTEKGEEGRSFRRPATLKELAEISQTSSEDIKEIIDAFRMPGRTILTPPYGKELNDDTIIDISHESLMNIWETLSNWMDEEYESTKQYLKIAEAAELHQDGKGGLLKSPELQVSTNWYYHEKPTKAWGIRHHVAWDRTIEFLLYSEKQFLREQRLKTRQQKRRLFIARLIALIFGIAGVVASILVIYAIQQREKAKDQEVIAREKAKEAEEQAELANIEKGKAEDARKEAVKSAKEAEIQKQMAQLAALRAEESRKKAESARVIADSAREKALIEEAKALKLRMFSIARSMAVKSLQEPDIKTKALVSRQAYNFYFNNGGTGTDPDIYNALYYSVKALKGERFNTLKGHTDNVRAIVTNGKSNKFYSTSSDGRIFSWSSGANYKFDKKLLTYTEGQVNKAMALSSNSKWLVVGGNYSYLMLFDLTKPDSKPQRINTGSKQTLLIAFTPDNKNIIYACSNKKIMIWNFNKSTEIARPDDKLNAMDIDPSGRYLATGMGDGNVYVFDLKGNFKKEILFKERAGNAITSLKYSEKSRMLAIGTIKGSVHILNSENGEIAASLTGHIARVNQITFNHADNKIATASFDHTVRIWDLDNLYNQPIVLDDHKDWVWSISFSNDDSYLMAGCRDKLVRAWIMDIDQLATTICGDNRTNRDLNKKEWEAYVADPKDIAIECTCKKNCK